MDHTATDLLTAKELAVYLKLSRKNGFRTVMQMARENRIPGSKIGDLWRFNLKEVIESLKKKRK